MEFGTDKKITPIFIFSMPRSGSTLLQRILMGHTAIASTAEPWILLPLIYANKKTGILSEYSHAGAYKAISDFVECLPQEKKTYEDGLKNFISGLYESMCENGEIFFLDKTPRYHLIIPEISRIFPFAKFIFLVRNPISIYSSMMETWGEGGFKNLHGYNIDLYSGPENLARGYKKLEDKSLLVSYESLLQNPYESVRGICSYLEIPFQSTMINTFSNKTFQGKFGDPTGTKEFSEIKTKTTIKWKKTVRTKHRQRIFESYLNDLSDDFYEMSGYSKNELLHHLKMQKTSAKFLLKDIYHRTASSIIVKYHLNFLFGNTRYSTLNKFFT